MPFINRYFMQPIAITSFAATMAVGGEGSRRNSIVALNPVSNR